MTDNGWNMKRERQIIKAIKLCKYRLNVGYDIGADCICAVMTLWCKGFYRVLKTTYIQNEVMDEYTFRRDCR